MMTRTGRISRLQEAASMDSRPTGAAAAAIVAAAGGRRSCRHSKTERCTDRPQSRKKDRKFCDRELARARIQRGYARQQHVRKQRKRRRRQQTLYLVLACKQHHEQRTDRAEHADHLLREIAAVIVEAGDDPQRNRRYGVQSPTGAARRGGLCLNASLRLSVLD